MLCLLLFGVIVATPPTGPAAWSPIDADDPAAVVEAGQQYLAAHPDDPAAHLAVANAMLDAGWNLRFPAARDHCRQVLTGTAGTPAQRGAAHLTLGRLAAAVDDADDALVHFRVALQSDPSCVNEARAQIAATLDAALVRTLRDIERYRGRGDRARAVAAARQHVVRAGCENVLTCVPDPAFYLAWGLAVADQPSSRGPDRVALLETAIQRGADHPTVAATAHAAMGRIRESEDDLTAAERHYAEVVRLAVDPTAVEHARQRIRHLGRDPYANWRQHSGARIVVHYDPTGPLAANPRPFVRQLDAAHRRIRTTLQVDPTERIAVWLYNNDAQMEDLSGRRDTWVDATSHAVHVAYGRPAGYGLVHCLSRHITAQAPCSSRVITEGLAMYLDQTRATKHTLARRQLGHGGLPGFAELERTFDVRDDAAVLAGSFTGFLLERFGRDQFLMFWRSSADGSFDRAFRRHYGHDAATLSEQWKTFLRAQ